MLKHDFSIIVEIVDFGTNIGAKGTCDSPALNKPAKKPLYKTHTATLNGKNVSLLRTSVVQKTFFQKS